MLEDHKLFANPNKCEFGKSEVAYLGHSISAAGIEVDQETIKAMTHWPTPTNLKELRGFLGLTRYYRKFVTGSVSTVAPLTTQLKKDSFRWNLEAERAFESFKKTMISIPILVMPDFTKVFILEIDSSGFGLGGCSVVKRSSRSFFQLQIGCSS